MAAYYLQIDTSTKVVEWSTVKVPPPGKQNLVIDPATDVISWKGAAAIGDQVLSCESTTDVLSWVT